MKHFLSALTVMFLAGSVAHAQLEIKNIEARDGRWGPKRAALVYYPMERICLCYDVSGASRDDKGMTTLVSSIKMTDQTGKEVFATSKEGVHQEVMGAAHPEGAIINLPDSPPPGFYTVAVTVKDSRNSQSATFQQKIEIRAGTFAITPPDFHYDLEGAIPAPPSGMVGQLLFFTSYLLGVDTTNPKMDVELSFQILDAVSGKPLGTQVTSRPPQGSPLASGAGSGVSFPIKFSGHLWLDRPGDVIVRFAALDRATGKTVVRDVPLHVTGVAAPAPAR